MYRWSKELEERIVLAVENTLKSYKHLDDEDELDKKRWKAIKALRIELGKDKIDQKCICTRLKEALMSEDYDTASALQVEMAQKLKALENDYRIYKLNILDD